jgi:hypothetical protein
MGLIWIFDGLKRERKGNELSAGGEARRGEAAFKIKSDHTWAASLLLHDVGTQSSASISTILRLYASAGTRLLTDDVAAKKRELVFVEEETCTSCVERRQTRSKHQKSHLVHTWAERSPD